MAGIIYGLCALTAFLCSCLLFKANSKSKNPMLLWGGVCFAGLTASNALLVVDKVLIEDTDFSTARYMLTLIAILVLLYGLIWEKE